MISPLAKELNSRARKLRRQQRIFTACYAVVITFIWLLIFSLYGGIVNFMLWIDTVAF